MGISSLGVGSSVLTQDTLDKLKAADKAQLITPIDKKISAEKSKSGALDIIDALVDNVDKSLRTLTQYGVFESRTATSSNEAAATITAADSSDVQDFSLDISDLAKKEIQESDKFDAKDAKIATGSGSMELDVGDQKYTFDYDDSMTLEDLKDKINKDAGSDVNATILKVASDDYRLVLSATKTGTGQDISITDNDSDLKTALTSDSSTIQDGSNAKFKFNGIDIERKNNTVTDLISGVTITLNKEESTNVSVQQDTKGIEDKVNNFIDKYNSAMFQLNRDTKSSQNKKERGAFSSDSTVKGMKRDLQNMINNVGSGLGSMQDYGIKAGRDGRLSLDTTKFEEKLKDNPANTKAFLSGGDFVKDNGSTVKVDGIFGEMKNSVDKYSKFGAILDDYKTSMQDRIKTLTQQQTRATDRLEAKYKTLQEKWSSYDSIISKLNNTSTSLQQMINSAINANKS